MFAKKTTPDAPVEFARKYASSRTISALLLREMSSQYGRSPGGYIWAVLEPLGALLVLSYALSFMVKAPGLGTSFFLFYATGYLPFSLYQSVLNAIAQAVAFSRPLLMYPSVTWLDAVIARYVLNSLTGLVVTFIIFSGALAFADTHTILQLHWVLLALFLASLLGLGIGTMNCFIMGVWPVWKTLWSVATRPLFLASGIFFTFESLPTSAQKILWYNPLIHIVGLIRKGFYPMYNSSYISIGYVAGVGMVTLMFGLMLLRRHHKNIIQN